MNSDLVFDIQFATSEEYSTNIKSYNIDKKAIVADAIKSFSYIFFIIHQLIDNIGNVEYAVFDGEDKKRQSLYGVMVNNKLLRNAIERNMAFHYYGEVENHFVFKNRLL